MQVQITFNEHQTQSPAALARAMRDFASMLDGSKPVAQPELPMMDAEEKSVHDVGAIRAEGAKKRGRPAKAKAAPVEEEEDDFGTEEAEDASNELELSSDDAPEAEDDEVEEAPAKPAAKKAAPKKTLDDVIAAFRAYAAKHSREKAAAVLKKLDVKSVRDIPAEKYDGVLKVLNA